MALLEVFFTSTLRGEVGANAPGEGFSAAVASLSATSCEPLTPTLSPQGRGGDPVDDLQEIIHGAA